MDDQNKNLILATGLSFLVILVWFIFFPPPEVTAPAPTAITQTEAATPGTAVDPAAAAPVALAAAPRVAIDTPRLKGSISLLGGRIDDLSLKTYRVTQAPGSDIVRLLSPVGEPNAYYALYGWAPGGALGFEDVPGANTEWTLADGATLTPDAPVTLSWDNGKGLVFTRTIAVDPRFMFTVTDSVQNNGAAEARLAPYGIIVRHGLPNNLTNFFVLHEGSVGRTDGILCERKYTTSWFGCDGFEELPLDAGEGGQAETSEAVSDGWLGFTDHFWMTALIPEQGKPFTSVTKYVPSRDTYQNETRTPVMVVAAGAGASSTSRLFAGAKEWEVIRSYQRTGVAPGAAPDAAAPPIPGFIDSIDWGWFFFLTKPIFALLHWLNLQIGNMGLAIIALTFVLKLIVLPLSYKSYVSMARMKELQPEMEALKARTGDDKQLMQKEMMRLYKERKVNPAAGCLPILIQIPIFFSLYKVIFVTLELRHAPFVGWLTDLSAPDSSSIFNLFGILPWASPDPGSVLALIFIGLLPIMLGISMWLQQKLNPAPADPTQQMIFAWMPWVFMFMLGSFASGLVVYWITNNLITFVQQYTIMRSHGHTPDIFGNIKSSFGKKSVVASVTGDSGSPAPPKPTASLKPPEATKTTVSLKPSVSKPPAKKAPGRK